MRIPFYLLLFLALIVTGCSGSGTSSTEMPTAIAVYTAASTSQPATAKSVVQTTATATATATTVPTERPTVKPTATPTDEPTATPTATPTVAMTVTATLTPSATATLTATLTATPAPISATVTLTPTVPATPVAATGAGDSAIYAGMPAEVLALMPAADAANGQALTVSNGCTACHSLEKDVRMVGPSWYSVGATAGERVAGESAALYLYTSIVEPNAFINEGYISGLMPLTYGTIFSDAQMADVIAYLLTLQGK